MTFENLNLHNQIHKALKDANYSEPTGVQAETIPYAIENRDILASAQTGTGKTAAFALPIINKILNAPREKGVKALIIAPTRELAMQIKQSFTTYTKYTQLKTTAVYGGVSKRNQIVSLKRGTDILVATPGRYLDLYNSKFIKTNLIKTFVLDEVDQMLDMGFIHDIKKIIDTVPAEKQTLVFSATIPTSIKPTLNTLLKDPKVIAIKTKQVTLTQIKQRIIHTTPQEKQENILDLLKTNTEQTLIFTNTKARAEKLTMFLQKNNQNVTTIHGDKPQAKRQRALNDFKKGNVKVLVATDVASRGIDIKELPYVINYDMPQDKDTYIHRIGRTGRASLSGEAISLCSSHEAHILKVIEAHINMQIPSNKKPAASKANSNKQNNKNKNNNKKSQPFFTKAQKRTKQNYKKRLKYAN